jgi:hypothetical protein|tara:strand:+ start:634 stop:1158 length:525 start_codon:yes stop_codon:yes gene_type:complete
MSNLKKRGRKPKNKIIVNDNPKFDNTNINDVIIKINNIIYDDNDDIDNMDNIDNIGNIDNTDNIHNICKNCEKKNIINNEYVPLKYINNIFYIKDTFCCEKCCEKYIFEKCNYNKYEIYSVYKIYKYYKEKNIDIIIKYIQEKKNLNLNSQKKINLKLYREKKENNILNFINNV